MNFDDPLGDTVPPRHAIESDDEDEFNPLTSSRLSTVPGPEEINVQVIGQIQTGNPLIVVNGIPGKVWARGADLGEQTGLVSVNKIQVGLVFNPSWTKATIITSEITTRLPLGFMAPYATTILDKFQPTRISVLDSYAVHTYISSSPLGIQNAPLRYLTTGKPSSSLSSKSQPFSPPNLILGTSAAFLTLGSVRPISAATLILLPSPQVDPPAPKKLLPSDLGHLPIDEITWPTPILQDATQMLLGTVGESETQLQWRPKSGTTGPKKPTASNHREAGEGWMYI